MGTWAKAEAVGSGQKEDAYNQRDILKQRFSIMDPCVDLINHITPFSESCFTMHRIKQQDYKGNQLY